MKQEQEIRRLGRRNGNNNRDGWDVEIGKEEEEAVIEVRVRY